MSPIKFENYIREKLEKRSIKPSNKSWDTLSSQLNKKKKNSSYKLLIAACLLGVVGTLILNFNKEIKVNEITEIQSDSISKEKINTPKVIISNRKNSDAKEFESDVKTNNKIKNSAKPNKHSETNLNENYVAEVKRNINQNLDSLNNKSYNTVPDSVLLNNEVEQLLILANLKIASKNEQDSSIIVNHNSLLQEAEIELEIDNTLKNRIYNAIVVNYNKISKTKKD